jgi:Cu(I)/Ag(I) efflux system membrane fusion protein
MGSKASVSVPSVAAAGYAGRVVFISPTVDPASRTFKIRIEIANPKRLLKPGLFAAVSF